MLFVKIGEREYLPFLREDSIRLRDEYSNTVLLSEQTDFQFMVKDLEAERDTLGNSWFSCDYSKLKTLLETKMNELADVRARVIDGRMVRDLDFLAAARTEVTI
jgi:hypothetical protein